jgi:predicted enzyme related to lactoylglutathione lyase
MAKITKLNHVAIVVRDIEESIKFWEESLGLSLTISIGPIPALRVAFIPVVTAKLNCAAHQQAKPDWQASLRKKVRHAPPLLEVDDIAQKLASIERKSVRRSMRMLKFCQDVRWHHHFPRLECVLIELYQRLTDQKAKEAT